jgi:hypothetical protein
MPAGKPSRREAGVVYVRNAHRWKDMLLAEGKEPKSRRRRLASSKGHFQEFYATARRFPLMFGAGRLWHKFSAVMTFVMAQIMEGLPNTPSLCIRNCVVGRPGSRNETFPRKRNRQIMLAYSIARFRPRSHLPFALSRPQALRLRRPKPAAKILKKNASRFAALLKPAFD